VVFSGGKMDRDVIFYLLCAVLVTIIILSIFTLKIILIATSLIFTVLLVAFYKLYYVIESMLFRHTNLIQVLDGHELSGDRATAIRKVAGKFSATAVALLESNPKLQISRENVENVIATSKCAFKFIMKVEHIDMNKLLDLLKTKRNMKEIELTKLKDAASKSNLLKINTVKRQIDLLNNDIEKISTGSEPLKVSQYIITSAISENRFNAQELAKSQLRSLSSQFSAILGGKSETMVGDELISALKLDLVNS
jgi:hypothetical protein